MNDEAIISQWNIDEYGNPISVKTEQETQVSVGGNLVQLRGIPDEMEGVTIEDKNGNTFFRVENLDEVYDNNYAYYLMKDGNVQFNPSQNGKLLYFKYYSKGVTLLSVSRIYYKDSYDNVVKILEDLIKAGFDALKVLEVFGGAKEVIDRLERDLDNGRALATQLEDVIAEGKPLQENLNADITEAKKWKDSLHKDVAEGKILQPQLHQDIIDGRETDANLTQTINSATELDDKIKTTGNASFIIEVENWIASDDSDWAYMYSLTTSLNSSDLVFKTQEITTKGFEDCLLYSIVKDSNTIAFYTDDKVRTKVIINARQYGGTIQDFSVVNTDLISEGASNKYVTPQEKVNIGTISDIKQQCELNKLSLEDKANIIQTFNSVNAKSFDIFKNNLTKDSTKGINDAILYCDSIGGGVVNIPEGKYLIEGTILLPRTVILKGSGKCFNGGTILWRNEDTNIHKPFIQLGSESGSANHTLSQISDFTIIGDTTVNDISCIENKSGGVHGIKIYNIDIEYFAGTPIMLYSGLEHSRVQFLEIDNVDIGFDWGTYKPEKIAQPYNNKCGGVWIKGSVDGVYIKNCRFTGYEDKSDVVTYLNTVAWSGIRIDDYDGIYPMNCFNIEDCFFRGFKHGVLTYGYNTNVNDCYFEHCKNGVSTIITRGGVSTNVSGNYFSGVENTCYIEDNRTIKDIFCHINANGNNIRQVVFEKVYLFDASTDISTVYIHSNCNSFPTRYNDNVFSILTNRTSSDTLVGQTSHKNYSEKYILNSPVIKGIGSDTFTYSLEPNTSSTLNNGLDIKHKDTGDKIATFHKNRTSVYSYPDGAIRKESLIVNQNGTVEFPLNIVLRGTGGKRYNVAIDGNGSLFTQLIN